MTPVFGLRRPRTGRPDRDLIRPKFEGIRGRREWQEWANRYSGG
jgi:hypothetical protein